MQGELVLVVLGIFGAGFGLFTALIPAGARQEDVCVLLAAPKAAWMSWQLLRWQLTGNGERGSPSLNKAPGPPFSTSSALFLAPHSFSCPPRDGFDEQRGQRPALPTPKGSGTPHPPCPIGKRGSEFFWGQGGFLGPSRPRTQPGCRSSRARAEPAAGRQMAPFCMLMANPAPSRFPSVYFWVWLETRKKNNN